MEHAKSRRIGGKGTPRLPPKRVSDQTDMNIKALTAQAVTANPSVAIINQKDNVMMFEQPTMKVFQYSKTPYAYVLSGKSLSRPNEEDPLKNAADDLLNESELKEIDTLINEEDELANDLKGDVRNNLKEDEEVMNKMGETSTTENVEISKEKFGKKAADKFEETLKRENDE